mmetsp:Transcript_16923/g.30325  ORF Transcript_16923/g.30325 Transcript_16923/m.30325 type:complete len:240 (-) Transcript_16923:157-876(-)
MTVRVLANDSSPIPIFVVTESRMVGLELGSGIKCTVCKHVDVRYLAWEPWNLLCAHQSHILGVADEIVHKLPHVVLLERSLKGHKEAISRVNHRRPRLDMGEVDPALSEKFQSLDKGTCAVLFCLECDGCAIIRIQAAPHELFDLLMLDVQIEILGLKCQLKTILNVLDLVERLPFHPRLNVLPAKLLLVGGLGKKLLHRLGSHIVYVILIGPIPKINFAELGFILTHPCSGFGLKPSQ